MEKISLTDKYNDLFHAEKKPNIIETPTLSYISINGKGSLFENPDYNSAISLLQGIAFFTKFKLKQNPPENFVDYRLPPFETIRWNTDAPTDQRKRKIMLLQPDFVTKEDTEHAYLTAKQKQEKEEDVTLPKMLFQDIKWSKYIQVLHTDSYTAQKRSMNSLTRAADKAGYELTGKQHEIYLKDPRKYEKIGVEMIIRWWLKKKK